MFLVLLAVIAAYLLGCLVGAYYVVRLRTGRDVRETGSGNAGARNVMRSGDRLSAVLTLLWDLLKGVLAIWLARALSGSDTAMGLAFIAVVAGHIWPAQLQFRGGKGVATAIGCLIAIGPRVIVGVSWPLLAAGAIACGIVIIVHHPAIDRHRRPLSVRAVQENS